MPEPILQLQDVGFAYPGQLPIANAWCLDVGPGITVLHGDTGSGKTTLLRVIAGELPATGELKLAGVRHDASPRVYRRHLFWCDPASDAFDAITARACTASLTEGDADFDEAEWRRLVEGFALAPHIDKPMYMLSTGSRRKVVLAAGLASGRPLTLLDEPTAALDGASVRCLWAALAAIAQCARRAVIVASSAHVDHIPRAGSVTLMSRS